MIRCEDSARLFGWLIADPVRYRSIIHDLDSPCPAWDEAMGRVDNSSREGGFILRDAQPAEEQVASEYYVDSLEGISWVAQARGRHVRVEGEMMDASCGGFVAWCRGRGVQTVETWSDEVHERLAGRGRLGPWKIEGGHYTVSMRDFRYKAQRPVQRLGSKDEAIWRRFVDRNASDPMVNARPGSQAVVRDFVFLSRGLPVDYYATIQDGEITGVASVNPMTRTVDEISMLFVDPRHRRKGFATSLMMAVTQDILSRGHVPAYCAAGSPQQRPDLHAMLLGLGYRLVVCPWTTRLAVPGRE